MRYRGDKGRAWEAVKAWCRATYKDCYTCPAKNLVGQNAHAGHYQPVAVVGSNNRRAWDRRFIKLQCGFCNGFGEGRQVVFRQKLVKELGEKVVADYDRKVNKKEVNPVKDWKKIIADFESTA